MATRTKLFEDTYEKLVAAIAANQNQPLAIAAPEILSCTGDWLGSLSNAQLALLIEQANAQMKINIGIEE